MATFDVYRTKIANPTAVESESVKEIGRYIVFFDGDEPNPKVIAMFDVCYVESVLRH